MTVSLGHPGRNLTGVSVQNAEGIPSKWLELMREMLPRLSSVALVVNRDNPVSHKVVGQVSRIASNLNIRLTVLGANHIEHYASVFNGADKRADAVIIPSDAVAIHVRTLIAQLAMEHRLPALGAQGEFAEAGGLMAYGPNQTVTWSRVAEEVRSKGV